LIRQRSKSLFLPYATTKYDLVKEMIAKRAHLDLDKTHLNPYARIFGYTTKGGADVDSIVLLFCQAKLMTDHLRNWKMDICMEIK